MHSNLEACRAARASPRCGAQTRRKTACQAPGVRMPDGSYSRCRMHGGTRARKLWKVGLYSMLRRGALTRAEVAEIKPLLSPTARSVRVEGPGWKHGR